MYRFIKNNFGLIALALSCIVTLAIYATRPISPQKVIGTSITLDQGTIEKGVVFEVPNEKVTFFVRKNADRYEVAILRLERKENEEVVMKYASSRLEGNVIEIKK
jgi:hypothetical protein